MVSVNDIGALVARKDPSPTERAKINRDEFMRILVAELSNQDPLNPIDHKDFLGQLASLQNLESSSALTESIYAMSRFQELGAASALIGKMVRGEDADGAPLSGVVERVLVEGKDVNLLVNGREIALANVREIMAAPAPGPR